MNERKEIMNMLRIMWRNGESSLRRIYPSWEDLESNIDILFEDHPTEETYAERHCPNCGITQKISKPCNEMFPFGICEACKRPFFVNKNLTVRKLIEEEKDEMPAEWIRILEDLNRKKLALVFRLE